MKHEIIAVAAIGRNRELGYKDKLLWHIPEDLKRFKDLTSGHPIIMGRRTFESVIGYRGKPLPNRTNIVVTRNKDFDVSQYGDSVLVAASVEEAIGLAKMQPGAEVISIGGGAQIYEQALPYTDKLYLTIIEATAKADTYFPEYESKFPNVVFEEHGESNGLKYRWLDFER